MKHYCGQRKAGSRMAAFCRIVKSKLISIIFTAALLSLAEAGFAQGFVNLNFEAANVSGNSGLGSTIPFSSAFPGWSGYYSASNGSIVASQAVYDGLSLGGAMISIIDSNVTKYGVSPIQGNYSVYLFGGGNDQFVGGADGVQYAAAISQTGLVPSGVESLLMDVSFSMYVSGSNIVNVTLGGEAISMVPLQNFSTYTLYGGDISSFANQTVQLNIMSSEVNQRAVLLDNIQFSSLHIPEPSELALAALGALFLGFHRRRR